MGSFDRIEPITLDYACDQPARRFTPLEKTLVGLLVMMGSFCLIVIMRPSFGSHSNASVDLTKANMGSLTSPLELYRQKVGAYPASLSDLYRLPSGMTQAAWGGPYVDSPSRFKDAWGREFEYKSPGTHNSQQYDLWSTGKDGEDATDDDIGNWAADDP